MGKERFLKREDENRQKKPHKSRHGARLTYMSSTNAEAAHLRERIDQVNRVTSISAAAETAPREETKSTHKDQSVLLFSPDKKPSTH